MKQMSDHLMGFFWLTLSLVMLNCWYLKSFLYVSSRNNILINSTNAFRILIAILSCSFSVIIYYVCAGFRSNNFIVGLTNNSPVESPPTLWNYTLCGQHPGAVPNGATVSLYCQDNLPPFRYVIVQFPRIIQFNFCEIEVFTIGKLWWCHTYMYRCLLNRCYVNAIITTKQENRAAARKPRDMFTGCCLF